MFRLVMIVLLIVVSVRFADAEEPKRKVDLVVTANNAFACDLYRQLAETHDADNLFFSPYSILSALTMTAEGAAGETAVEMGKVLKFSDIAKMHPQIAALNASLQETDAQTVVDVERNLAVLLPKLAAVRDEMQALQKQRNYRDAGKLQSTERVLTKQIEQEYGRVKRYEVRITNALWGEKSFPFRDEFVKEVGRHYKTGGLFPVDFRNDHEAVRHRINAWVERHTNNRITNLLSPGTVDPLTRLVLTNAIYFQGDWDQPFQENRTRDQDFHLTGGAVKSVPMMSQMSHKAAYYAAFNADGSLFETPQKIQRGQAAVA